MKLLVCGGRKFADVKCLQNALNAVHQKHHITTLIVGAGTGAPELAYFWGVSKPIREIITVPIVRELLTGRANRERHALDMLDKYQPDAIVAFSYPQPDPIIHLAQRHGFKVWNVPAGWRT